MEPVHNQLTSLYSVLKKEQDSKILPTAQQIIQWQQQLHSLDEMYKQGRFVVGQEESQPIVDIPAGQAEAADLLEKCHEILYNWLVWSD